MRQLHGQPIAELAQSVGTFTTTTISTTTTSKFTISTPKPTATMATWRRVINGDISLWLRFCSRWGFLISSNWCSDRACVILTDATIFNSSVILVDRVSCASSSDSISSNSNHYCFADIKVTIDSNSMGSPSRMTSICSWWETISPIENRASVLFFIRAKKSEMDSSPFLVLHNSDLSWRT